MIELNDGEGLICLLAHTIIFSISASATQPYKLSSNSGYKQLFLPCVKYKTPMPDCRGDDRPKTITGNECTA
jgi:hypothetical protein